MKLWIKMPGPGQRRGEGAWQEADMPLQVWEWFARTGFFPTFVGSAPPVDENPERPKMH